MDKKLNVLVVDDSASVRELLTHIVNSAPDMHAVGLAKDGLEAVQMTQSLHPDVILMDLIMPRMDGLEATREIMHQVPTPIVLVTASLSLHETNIAFRAMSLGALAVQRKPVGPGNAQFAAEAAQLVNKLRLMAGVQVIRHRKDRSASGPSPVGTRLAEQTGAPQQASPRPVEPLRPSAPPEIIGIVSSTGGPAALVSIIQQLPPDFAVPVVIVQHISSDFIESLRGWLARSTTLPVELALDGLQPRPGVIYLAPGGRHLRLSRAHRFEHVDEPSDTYHIPSGDPLLESIGLAYGKRAIGVILTGIGEDGARGMKVMADAGAFTIAQDEATSAVYGMPKAAYAMGAVRQVLPLPEIGPALARLAVPNQST